MARYNSSTMGRHAGLWLVVTALFELALAAVFVAIGLSVPVVDFGMFLTAVVLGVTGLVLLVIGWKVRSSAAANEQLLRDGMPGTATITGLTQTGMYLNENPQVAIDMMVDVHGRAPYAATRKEFVPLILLGRLSSGAPLAVRVDRANPQRLVIDWEKAGMATSPAGTPPIGFSTSTVGYAAPAAAATVATPGGVTANMAPAPASDAAPAAASAPLAGLPYGVRGTAVPEVTQQLAMMRSWLRQTGEVGTARIDAATDTGVMVGAYRLFTIEATLELPGRAPEKLPPVAAMVASDEAAKVRVGYRVSVRVAPDNHQLIDFDW